MELIQQLSDIQQNIEEETGHTSDSGSHCENKTEQSAGNINGQLENNSENQVVADEHKAKSTLLKASVPHKLNTWCL